MHNLSGDQEDIVEEKEDEKVNGDQRKGLRAHRLDAHQRYSMPFDVNGLGFEVNFIF